MKEIWNWFVTSSADPQKTSLLIKGVLTGAGAYALQAFSVACGLGLFCVGLDALWINQVIESATAFVLGLLFMTSALMSLWGALRKLNLGRWSWRPLSEQ